VSQDRAPRRELDTDGSAVLASHPVQVGSEADESATQDPASESREPEASGAVSEGASDLKRVLSSSGIYAAAALAQRGLAFILLPIYTRFIDPAQFGVLELLTAFSTIVFGFLMMGLPSAIMKCYHRDCPTAADKARLLPTALTIAVPVLLLGGGLLFKLAPLVSRLLVGVDSAGPMVRLVLATGVLSSLSAIILANLRAQERATAFSVLTLTQFLLALTLNILVVVKFGMGIQGVLWGNFLSNAVALPLAIWAIRSSTELAFQREVVPPLVRFGLLLIPVVLSGWVTNMSDRWVLRLFSGLEEVAVYGVGYKFGMIIELAVVWPFQLAWPAFSFSISHRPDHRLTYAKALTYLSAVLAYLTVGLSLIVRVAVPWIVGEKFQLAYQVVPLIALAYALNGVQYCMAPGVHLSEKTRYLTNISIVAALLNLGLNFLLIPRWGMMGAAWATVASFLLVAIVIAMVSTISYGVRYEVGRLTKITVAALGVYLIGAQVEPATSWFSISWHLVMSILAFPLILGLWGFFEKSELAATADGLRRFKATLSGMRRARG
jgi:O-antigen/teichoic acid export membrane protein